MNSTFKLNDIVASVDGLQLIANTKMPIKVSYNLNKMLRMVQKEMAVYEEERKKIFEEYGDEKNGIIQIRKDEKDAAEADLSELLDQEVILELPTITLDDLEGLEITPIQLQAVEPFLKEPKDIDLPPELTP